ncbi:MAG: ABC transporter permease, partial [Lachnospiraceae bacterium]|nr:ABC transporter permease [Lachnospiraceae bacterium]
FGGFSHAGEAYVTKMDEGFLVNAPIIILDDVSFLAYCGQIGITPRLDGAVILNRIRDVTNPDFRHPEYMPYIKGESDTSVLRQAEREEIMTEIPVLAYTEEVPVLREEYATIDYYELVHFLPASLWRENKGQIGGCEEDLSVCILSGEDLTAEKLSAQQGEIDRLIGSRYTAVSENRIQEKEINDRQIRGMMAIFGGFCVLLAIIGIGNVFSNTLGFVHQRKREFARYLSVGMTPGGIRKLFCIEALVLVGRPFMISLPIALLAAWAMLRASYLPMGDFLTEAPFIPVVVFGIAVLDAVALAYYLGWRQVKRIDLPEVLRDDSML